MELKVPVVIDNEYIKKAVEEIKGEIKKDYVPRSVIEDIRTEIEDLKMEYDKSPLTRDDRTDAEKHRDWWEMEKLIVLSIIDRHIGEESEK